MKQTSQGTRLYVGTSVGVPSTPVTAITKAAPPLLTWLALPAGLATGDVVIPAGFGWRSIDNRPFALANAGTPANTAELHGADTVDEINAALLGTVAEVEFGEACMVTITLSSPAGTTIDVTTLCDEARETIDGLPAVSTWQATGFWDAEDPMQKVIRDLYRSGQKVPFKLVFPDGSGCLFMGTVNQFDVTAGVDQAVAFTTGGNISGPIVDIPAGGVESLTVVGAARQPPPEGGEVRAAA